MSLDHPDRLTMLGGCAHPRGCWVFVGRLVAGPCGEHRGSYRPPNPDDPAKWDGLLLTRPDDVSIVGDGIGAIVEQEDVCRTWAWGVGSRCIYEHHVVARNIQVDEGIHWSVPAVNEIIENPNLAADHVVRDVAEETTEDVALLVDACDENMVSVLGEVPRKMVNAGRLANPSFVGLEGSDDWP